MVTAGEEQILDAITFSCAECGQELSICKSCWRGQKYCGEFCRIKARRKQRCEIQKRYSSTDRGLESGRIRQQRRYEKIKLFKSSH
jgi:hypothetical protein